MSGGVDSAVAAARAVDAGHDVVGRAPRAVRDPGRLRTGSRGCCSREDAADARRAADVLGIPFYVWDFAARFTEDVVDDFVAAYAAGQTPNPCLRCNEKIKFAALLDKALALGFDAVCTGHYARLAAGRAAPRRRRGQGPVLRARRAHRAPAGARDVPDRRHPEAGRARRGRRARAAGGRQAGQPRHLLHPLRRHPGLPRRADSASGPARSSTTPPARSSPATTACTGSPSASARASAIDAPAADGRPALRARDRAGHRHRAGRPGQRARRAARSRAPARCGRRRTRPGPGSTAWRRSARTAAGHRRGRARRRDGLRVELAEPLRGVAPGQAVALYRPDAAGDVVLGSATITATA